MDDNNSTVIENLQEAMEQDNSPVSGVVIDNIPETVRDKKDSMHDNGDDNTHFSYPSDVSHYTLDKKQKVTNSQSVEHEKWENIMWHNRLSNKTSSNVDRYIDYYEESFIVSKEHLNVGDEITYFPIMNVQGYDYHKNNSIIFAIDPEANNGYKVSTLPSTTLDNTQKIKRTNIMHNKRMINHPGIFRRLCAYTLTKNMNFYHEIHSALMDNSRLSLDKAIEKSVANTPLKLRPITETVLSSIKKKKTPSKTSTKNAVIKKRKSTTNPKVGGKKKKMVEKERFKCQNN